MATADPAALDDFLNTFKTKVDMGFGLIQGDVSATLATLVTISIVITAVLWAIDENQNVLSALVRKIFLVGSFAFLVAQWPTLASTVVNGFAALGLRAGGGSMTVSTFMTSPSQIVMAGITVVAALMQYVQKIAPGPFEFFNHIDVVLMAIVAAIGILLAFVILAVEIVVTIIEFHIVTLAAFVTIPFGVLTQTSFMSERAIGYVVSVGVKMMALAIVVSLGTTVFNTYTVSADPGVGEDVGLLLAAVVMVMLALKVPAIAGALISGGPQLNAGGAAMGAAGLAAGVAGAGLAARIVGGAGASGWGQGGAKIADAKSAAGAAGAGGAASVPAPRAAGRPGAAEDQKSSSPRPADTLARASARQGSASSDVLSVSARSAVGAAAHHDEGGPGMTAAPARPHETDA